MIHQWLKTRASQYDQLVALIGQRFYGGKAPQGGKAPYIVFQKLGLKEDSTYCGPDGAQMNVFSFDSYDISLLGATTLAKVLRDCFVGFTGVLNGTKVKLITLETELDVEDPDFYRVLTTLIIWNEEVN